MLDKIQMSRERRARECHPLYLIYLISDGSRNYVGCTKRELKACWQQQCREALKAYSSDNPLYAAIRERGADAFRLSIIAEAMNEEDANRKKLRYTKEYDARFPRGYNISKRRYSTQKFG